MELWFCARKGRSRREWALKWHPAPCSDGMEAEGEEAATWGEHEEGLKKSFHLICSSWKASALTPSAGPMDHHLQNPPQTTLYPEQFFLWCKLKTEPEALLPASSKYGKHNYTGCGFLTSKTILQILKGVTMCKANLKKDTVNFSSGESTSNPKQSRSAPQPFPSWFSHFFPPVPSAWKQP